jgi:hypothetical protein
MKRDNIIDYNDKIELESKINIGEFRIFEGKKSKSQQQDPKSNNDS